MSAYHAFGSKYIILTNWGGEGFAETYLKSKYYLYVLISGQRLACIANIHKKLDENNVYRL